ncbi:MAG: tetratricopeptide repeat protein [Bacteroidales bacterium]|nr:tetratricopeptide repeat protein [Bacteroidales bacterium]
MKEDYNKAVDYYSKSLKVNEQIGSKKGVSICLNCLGGIYLKQKSYDEAEEMYKQALAINQQLKDKIYTSWSYINIGEIQTIKGKYSEAEINLTEGLRIAQEIGSKAQIEIGYLKLSQLFSKTGKYKDALAAFEKSKTYRDSIINEKNNSTIAKLKTIYETEKKEKEIQSQKLELALKNREILKEKAQKVIFIGGFAAMILVSLLFYRNYHLKKKANVVLTNYNRDMDEKNHILLMQKEEIMAQRDQIEEKSKVVNKAYNLIKNKNKNIIENIRYAFQIQNALLTPAKTINEYFPNSFILYKPRDIVSGDFYWLFQKDQKIIVAAADCTGHGVSGAFMSILGLTALNEIVNEKGVTRTDQILNQLRERIIWSLQQEEKFWEAKDGIDMTVFSFDLNSKKVMFSGANASAILIRNEELIQYKGDKMPVSIFPDIIPFTYTEFEVFPGDVFFLFSDGYYHQFGGLYGKKFSIRQFTSLLMKIHKLDAQTQQIKLEETFRKWRSRNEQVDDILVMGFTLTEEMFQNNA